MAATDEAKLRQALIDTALKMNASGLNHGTSGNVSVRIGAGMLITPTSRAYDTLTPDDICEVALDGVSTGPHAPSSEWRFHRDIYCARPDAMAVVHAHPDYATALAIHQRSIPAVHYMVAVFGGAPIRCAPYAIYGSQELSDHALEALEGRKGCLLAHHGTITLGDSLEQAYWLAWELETLARQHHSALLLGEPPTLSEEEIDAVIAKIGGYGMGGQNGET